MTEPVLWIRSALCTWQVGGSGSAAVKYWSSSQFSATYAWLQNFFDSVQRSDLKTGLQRVRPVRAF